MSTVALHFSSARCALATSKCIQKNIEIIALKDASRIGKTIRVAQTKNALRYHPRPRFATLRGPLSQIGLANDVANEKPARSWNSGGLIWE
jgi:hypothetical protein